MIVEHDSFAIFRDAFQLKDACVRAGFKYRDYRTWPALSDDTGIVPTVWERKIEPLCALLKITLKELIEVCLEEGARSNRILVMRCLDGVIVYPESFARIVEKLMKRVKTS